MKTKTYLIMSIALLAGMSVWAQKPVTVSIYDDCSKNGKTEDIRPRQAVDLGLPSGLKWASCNVGATTPEGYGDYFAWGETAPKTDYSWATYKYASETSWGDVQKLTKYCDDASFGDNGFTDDKTTLDPEDDAAHVNWGGSWRMPTDAEWTELRTQCTWTWTTQNGVNGYQVSSKTNGNSIFLPAAGQRSNARLLDAGSLGSYWSSSSGKGSPHYVWVLCFDWDSVGHVGDNRFYGFSVRPVCP